MNTYLYIPCDSVTKINFSKTLQKLRQQKIDSLFTASLSLFLKEKVKSKCTRFRTCKKDRDEATIAITNYKQATFDTSQCSETQRGAVVPFLKQRWSLQEAWRSLHAAQALGLLCDV